MTGESDAVEAAAAIARSFARAAANGVGREVVTRARNETRVRLEVTP